MKELVFLPDREGRDELSAASGFVRVGTSGKALKALSDRLVLPPREVKTFDVRLWRGILTLALLCDVWPAQEAAVTALEANADVSPFAAWVLSARRAQQDKMHLILLEKGGNRHLLGIADEHLGIVLPATPTDFADAVPARAVWYDAAARVWHDPVPCLNETERMLLLARMNAMGLDAPEAAAFKADLEAADSQTVSAVCTMQPEAVRALRIRLQAVCALDDFESFSVREEPCNEESNNPLVDVMCQTGAPAGNGLQCATWLWQGIPFARTSAALGLTETDCPEQNAVLDDLEAELALLAANSTRWNQRCADGITRWLDARGEALLPEVRQLAEELRGECRARAMEPQAAVTLTWPWDAASGAVKYLLQECLGDNWLRAAGSPFSDCLTKLTGHMLGDTVLQYCCACADGVLLPPLSPEMAKCVANSADGEGLAADTLRFDPREDGGITASFLLRGRGEAHLTRTYRAEEILVLEEKQSPCVAVWPCLPMAAWRAYHVFVKGGDVTVAALSDGAWKALSPAAEAGDWRCLRTESYPACLTLTAGNKSLGVLPNHLPARSIAPRGDALVAIDMGASATATVIRMDGQPVSAQCENLTRLLVHPREMAEDAFLGSLIPGELTPSAVKLTGSGDALFHDGYVYAVPRFEALQALPAGSVCTQLKWRADERSVRARRILLHQVMLGASLTAMLAGAKSVRWRLTVADEMADEGRDALLNVASELSVEVAEETGLMLTDGKFMVSWAEEAAATHAYLRNGGGMKGSFAVLDIGGGSTKLHLWMQGKHRPLGGAVLMSGSSTTLLQAFRAWPDMLREDFADCGDDALLAKTEALCEQLARAGESVAQADKALLMLDALLEEHKQTISRHMYARFSAQQPTYMQAILLELYAAALFDVGLMLEQSGGDTNINHLFPSDLNICLTGRGGWLLDTLTPQQRNGLQYIAHEPMYLSHPVRTLTLRPAQMPAMGTAMGMAILKETQVTNDTPVIRTRRSFSELMRMLMVQLFQCCPLHVWKLHPGFFDQWGNMTQAGEDTIRRVASLCYGDGDDIPGAVLAVMARLRLTAAATDYNVSPGE